MSLLKRLGQTKEQARDEAIEKSALPAKNGRERKPEELSLRRKPPRQAQKILQRAAAEAVPVLSYVQEQEHLSPDMQVQAASSFAGRHSSMVQDDTMQKLRLSIHQRLVDEMTPEESFRTVWDYISGLTRETETKT